MLVVALGVALLVWQWFGSPDVSGPYTDKERLEIAKIVLAVVGGLGGVVFLTVSYRKQRDGENAEARLDSAESREQAKHYHERFGAASDQLGSERAAVRLAGVHAMASLADDWEHGRQTCIEVLCAYMRMPYDPPEAYPLELTIERRHASEERQIRHALFNIVGKRLRGFGEDHRTHTKPSTGAALRKAESHSATWQGCEFDFRGATIDGGEWDGIYANGCFFDFSNVTFIGGTVLIIDSDFEDCSIHLDRAIFQGGGFFIHNAYFRASRIDGSVKLESGTFEASHSTFVDSIADFSRIDFRGGLANFTQSSFNQNTRVKWPIRRPDELTLP